jgi:hypothetical protein
MTDMGTKRPVLAELVEAGGGVRRKFEPDTVVVEDARQPGVLKHQKSREGTVAITVMQHEDVRMQLKMLAIEKRDTIENLVADALNGLFRKHGKPEIALIKKRKGRAA